MEILVWTKRCGFNPLFDAFDATTATTTASLEQIKAKTLLFPKRQRLNPVSTTAATTTDTLDDILMLASAMSDPSILIGPSLERILDSIPLQSDKEILINGNMRFASALNDAGKRSERKIGATHNMSVWPLNADLTIKMFSMLDTKSVCCAAATCTLFSNCAADPLCYANIDLTRSVAKLHNAVVSTMIQRAGKNLQSIKLGRLPREKETLDKSPLTGSCLSALVLNGGAAGLLLRQLHLYNLKMQGYNLCSVLSACRSLAELEVVGVDIRLDSILSTICEQCHSIERLCLDTRATSFYDALNLEAGKLENLIKKCLLLSSLTLKGYVILDNQLCALIKGACGMKSLDLSGSYGFFGNFLGEHGYGGGSNSLETLILRDCDDLTAKEVSDFLSAICLGEWKALRHVDISNSRGLDAMLNFCSPRCAIDVSQILQERPDIHLIADYPPKLCFFGGCTCSPPPSSSRDENPSSSSYSCDAASSSDDEDIS